MERSHWANYVEERLGVHTIENEDGFVTYHFTNGACYIVDVYVVKEKRKTGTAKKFLALLEEESLGAGIMTLVGQVNPLAAGATDSLKMQFALGFEIETVAPNGTIFLKKSLKVGE